MEENFNKIEVMNIRFIIEEIYPEKKVNAEEYFKEKMISIGFKVKKNRDGDGIPDFTCSKNGEEFYVEVKTNHDGLGMNQIQWISKHPEITVYVFILNQKTSSNKMQPRWDKKQCNSCEKWKDSDLIKKINGENKCVDCIHIEIKI